MFAQQRFVRGLAFYEAHEFQSALTELRASVALFDSPNTRLYLARCLRELGRVDEAVPHYEWTITAAADRAEREPRYAATRDAARRELALVEPQVGRLTITITPSEPPAGAHLRVGPREVPIATLGAALVVLPGTVEVALEAPGFETARGSARIAPGQQASLALTLAPQPVSHPPQETPRRAGGSGLIAPGIVLLGLGAVGAAGFIAFGILDANLYQSSVMRCAPTTVCPNSEIGTIDTGRNYQILANVGLGVGIGGIAVGTVLLIVGAATGAARPAVTVQRNGVELGVRF